MFDLIERIESGETVDLNKVPMGILIELSAFCSELEQAGDERHPELRRRIKKLQDEVGRSLDDFIADLDF